MRGCVSAGADQPGMAKPQNCDAKRCRHGAALSDWLRQRKSDSAVASPARRRRSRDLQPISIAARRISGTPGAGGGEWRRRVSVSTTLSSPTPRSDEARLALAYGPMRTGAPVAGKPTEILPVQAVARRRLHGVAADQRTVDLQIDRRGIKLPL